MNKAILAIPAATFVPPPDAVRPAESAAQSEVMDWDATIEAVPLRPQGSMQVQLVFGGRSLPLPVDDPGAGSGV